MNQEDKIKELQEKIYKLSIDVNSSLHQLRLLQAALDELQQVSSGETNKIPVVLQNKNITTHPSASDLKPLSIENFIGLKLMHLVGIVVLVTGISIGVKYAIDKELISEAMRILLAYSAGILLFLLSVRLKKKYLLFSAILYSGSMASVYFTTYAAFVYYQFLPTVVTFLLMVALTIYTVVMSISYNRKEIAVIGMIGAYGIPFLISANAERVDLFFSYIFMINIGVVFLSFKKGWKQMGYLALAVTWMLFIGWSLLRYSSSQQGIAIVFMALYYILFLINAMAFRISRQMALTVGDIQQIIVNNTALYFAAIIVFGNGAIGAKLAGITGSMFLLTGLLAFISSKTVSSENILQRVLSWQSLLFLLLFIVFQWDGLTVSLLWVALSVLLFTWGIVAQMSWARLASVILIGITLIKLLLFDSDRFSTIQKISCYIIIGVLLLVFSFYYQKLGLTGKKQDS
ncbi:MAG: DUF2339 domain-containing protein [Chitinophagaceae bacterium]